MGEMFTGVTLSTTNYDALLIGWGGQTAQSGVNFAGGNSAYSSNAAATARRSLTDAPKSWIITDGVVELTSDINSSDLGLSGSSDVVGVADGVTLTLDGNLEVSKLILGPTAKVSLGSFTLNAPNGVVLQSSAAGSATILGNNAVSNASVEQYVTAGRNWYISSPLSNAGYAELSRGASVVEWNEATKNWDTKSSGTLTRGKGYIQVSGAAQGTTGTLSFDGTTNAGNVDVAVTRTESGNGPGFNLVGNPYPSYLD